jgi:lactose/L-arabinose transport system substrate-binding protein
MFRRTKLSAQLIVTLLFSLFAISCSSAATANKTASTDPAPPHITIWAWDIAAKGLQDTVQAFHAKYPNVKVTIIDIPWGEVEAEVPSLITKGKSGLPDIIAVGESPVLADWLNRYPTAFVNLAQFGAAKYAKQFDSNKWNLVQSGTKVFGLPWDSAPVGLFYRKDILENAGIDLDQIQTWDDWYQAGIKLKAATNGKMKLMTGVTSKTDDLYMYMLQQQGLSIFDAKGQISISNPKSIKTLSLLQKMVKSGIIYDTPNGKPDILYAAKQEKAASLLEGVWFTGLFADQLPEQKGKWRVMMPPSFEPNLIQSGNIGGSFLVVSKTSKYPKIAYSFIENALATTHGQLAMFKHYSLFPSYMPSYQDASLNQPVQYFGGQPIWRLFAEAAANIPPVNYTKDYKQSLDIVAKAIEPVLSGNADPKTALYQAATQIAAKTGRAIAKTS